MSTAPPKKRRKKAEPIAAVEKKVAAASKKAKATGKPVVVAEQKPPIAPLPPSKQIKVAVEKTAPVVPAALYEIPGLPISGGPREVGVSDSVHLDLPPDIAQWVWSIVEAKANEHHQKYSKYEGQIANLAVFAKRAETTVRLFRAAIPGAKMDEPVATEAPKRKARKKAS